MFFQPAHLPKGKKVWQFEFVENIDDERTISERGQHYAHCINFKISPRGTHNHVMEQNYSIQETHPCFILGHPFTMPSNSELVSSWEFQVFDRVDATVIHHYTIVSKLWSFFSHVILVTGELCLPTSQPYPLNWLSSSQVALWHIPVWLTCSVKLFYHILHTILNNALFNTL